MRLTMLLEMAQDGFGDRVVVGGRRDGFTATDLATRADSGAGLIREAGADALIYLAVNGPAFPVAMFAAAKAGVPLVPLNYRLGATQLRDLLAKHPKAIAITDPSSTGQVEAAGLSWMSPQDWLQRTTTARGPVDPEEGADPATAVIIYTSGTTSAPKGVLLRHANLVSYVLGSVEFAGAEASEAALVSVPPYHIAAVANVISNLFAGRRTLVLESFTPEQWLDLVRQEEVTNALVVPTMLARIIDSDASKVVPSLRSLAYGGAPMPAPIIERALALWPTVGFVNAYGLTETSSTVAVLGPEEHRDALASTDPRIRARLSSVGKVLPGVDLVIRDSADVELPAGVTGRICVRGEQVSAEYAGVGRAVDGGGYFDTRDEGYLDDEGYLFIGGRVDDTIIRGAENIAPAEIEDVLVRHPAVADVVVFGVPDETWGQRIEAAIVVKAGASLEVAELREFAKAILRTSKTPERFWFRDELPRTETGKLLRRVVVDEVVNGVQAVGG